MFSLVWNGSRNPLGPQRNEGQVSLPPGPYRRASHCDWQSHCDRAANRGQASSEERGECEEPLGLSSSHTGGASSGTRGLSEDSITLKRPPGGRRAEKPPR